jgi:5'-deoxynucleotidase YfbR-like HD superfamily hydrolase
MAGGKMTHTVNRWHCHPDERLRNSGDTIDEHQFRVWKLCIEFSIVLKLKDRSELCWAAQTHDEAEKVLGDMPGPAKERFPALAAAYAEAERDVLAEMGLSWSLTSQEAAILHLADKLDADIWARNHGVTDAHDGDKLQSMADALGLGEMVKEMLK